MRNSASLSRFAEIRDGQITPEMIQAADQEIKTRFPVFYDTTELSARHDLIRAIFLTMLAID